MFILDESEIYYMSDIRKLLEQDRLEFEADQKIKNLDNIVQALRNGRLSIFAGAGLSASSGYVNWKQLIKPMSDYLGLNINTDLTMIAQYYENECTREGLNRAILSEFSKVPTKNGYHILVTPFNPNLFKDKFPKIDLHKDNPTILYIP